MALAETARMLIEIDLKGNATTGISKLNKQLSGLDRGVGRVGKGVGQVSAGFARAGLLVGGAAVTGLTAAAKAAIDFEDAFAGVRKTVDEADLKAAGLSFETLATSFRNMATEVPIAATEFARIGEIAGALGVEASSIEEFTKTVALMGVTTNLSSDEAADAFGRIGTILNLTGKDYEELADSIVALGNAGASTESEITEITKRFAAEGKAAGLAKEDIVGLASVTASLGFAPERGGTALARVFANMATNIATANKKGQALSKGVGKPIKDLQRAIDRGEGLPIFLDVLKEIKGMKPTEAARFLKSIGVTNVSDRTIFRAMADQLPEVNRQLGIATDATGALSKEAQKRFDTVASKIQLFRNNLTEAAITIGEGMIPAIGRAAEKLSAFLRQDENRQALKDLGKDIGQTIDDIDWNQVITQGREIVDILKGAAGWAKRLFDAFNALPGPLKQAAAGFIVLNKLSGGLLGGGVGNILGGLGETVTRNLGARLPGVGKAFVQPVFVTNMPAGGLGTGVGAPKGGGGAMGKAAGVLKVAGGVSIVGIVGGAAATIAGVTRQSENRVINAQGNIVRQVVTPQMQAQRTQQAETQRRLEALRAMAQRTKDDTVRATNQTRVATQGVRTAELSSASRIVGATNAQTGAIVGALYATRVTVQSVTKNTTIVQRYGPSNGSSGRFGQ